MQDFNQWMSAKGMKLNEKGKRTALSANYPSLYHSQRQQPRQTWTPISATAALADKQIGPDEKVTDGGPNVTSKDENPHKSFYNTSEWSRFIDKKIAEVQSLNQMDEIAPAIAAVGRAALPHIARGAGAAVANKVMQPKKQQNMKHMHDGDKPWMKTKGHPGKHKKYMNSVSPQAMAHYQKNNPVKLDRQGKVAMDPWEYGQG